MKYCTRCLYPENHPLYLTFDAQGVCSGCRVHEEKDSLNWIERFEKLKKITTQFRTRTRSIHDCIIPVSGARDSYFIVHIVKNILKLNPLLVTYNKHYNTKIGIQNLAYLRSLLGCDLMTMFVSPERVKKITKETLRLKASMYWHCLAGQTAFPVQIAVKFKIPLIIWGAHQGIDQTGMFSHLDEVEMTRKYRHEHDLLGLEAMELLEKSNTLCRQDIEQYLYPHDKEIEAVGIRGIYLNNYLRWDTIKQHKEMIKLYDYKTFSQQRTFDEYNDVDCFHYSGIHDYIKFLKFGYGKVSDHASREIRLKRLTREEGISLVQNYVNNKPNDLNIFLEWLGMQENEFYTYINQHRDSRIWEDRASNQWHLKDSVILHENDPGVNDVRLEKTDTLNFSPSSSQKNHSSQDKYILMGRGWVD